MRKLFILLLLLPVPAWATVTVGDISLDACNGATPTVCTSTAKNHAAGNGIIISIGTTDARGTVVDTCTDTAGDTIVSAGSLKRTADNGDERVELWYVLSTNGHASNVITCPWLTDFVANGDIRTTEIDYDGTLTFDTGATSSGEASATTYPVAQFSSSGAGFLYYSIRVPVACTTAPGTPAFTDVGDNCGAAYRITGAAASNITPTGTSGTSQTWVAVVGSWVESGAAATGGKLLLLGVGL